MGDTRFDLPQVRAGGRIRGDLRSGRNYHAEPMSRTERGSPKHSFYLVRRDDKLACANIPCRKPFEITRLQSLAFLNK